MLASSIANAVEKSRKAKEVPLDVIVVINKAIYLFRDAFIEGRSETILKEFNNAN